MNIRSIIRFWRPQRHADRIKRFEILLPLNYNDGSDIEPEKFDETAEELADHFGGITQDTIRITGIWKYEGARYRDILLRIRVDSTDADAADFLRTYKELLKERFDQIDIWITAHDIEII
jgi:hypothetical protein